MRFFLKIFSPVFLILSICLLTYTFYKSQIIWNNTKIDFYLDYYLISISLVTFSIITFFFNNKLKEYFLIFLFSITVAIYIYEGFLTFREFSNSNQKKRIEDLEVKKKIYEKEENKKYDIRTKKEIYEDLIQQNKNIKLAISPRVSYLNKNYSLFPLSGISHSETIHQNENGYYSIYMSDRFGFNNPDKEWESKDIEYLLVGDSFTHGNAVNRPFDIASVLRSLSNKSVINIGYDYNGPLLQYASVREYLRPGMKKIIWIYFEGNDLRELYFELKDRTLKNYFDDPKFSQKLTLRQNEINNLANTVLDEEIKKQNKTKKIKFNNLKNFLLISKTRAHLKPEKLTIHLTEFKKIIKLTKNLALENNSKLYFVYLPDYYRYTTMYDNTHYLDIKNILKELKIPLIDIHNEVFKKEKDPLNNFPFRMLGHYNIKGYNKVARTIYKLTN